MNLINSLTRSYVTNTPYDVVSGSIGTLLVVLALAAIVLRVVLEAGRNPRRGRLRHFDVLAAPLVLALAILVANRLIDLFPR